MKIAVDFDGTIVENAYPDIGKPMLFAFDTLKALQKKGHYLILWTYRDGDKLQAAVDFCSENGIEFYAINHSYPEEGIEFKHFYNKISRKIDADVFIDDRNVGGFIGWSKVWQMIHPESGELKLQFTDEEAHYNFRKKSFFSKLFTK
jgi:hydroxymethylpyrimidine pyrophosphatase-like HAD family hydrolase